MNATVATMPTQPENWSRWSQPADSGWIRKSVQIAMIAGLSYTALRDAILTHPTMVEGLTPLFSSVPSAPKQSMRMIDRRPRDHSPKKVA